MQQKWQISTLLGIPIYIDSSWLLILALVTMINAGDIYANDLAGGNILLGWGTGLLMALLLFCSVLLHELGHSLVARSQGITVNSITLFLFGGIASIEQDSKTPAEAVAVAIAGPLVSITLFILFTLLSLPLPAHSLGQYLVSDIATINLILALFNLIPGLPLDGGQLVKALVWKLKGDRATGVRWAAASGRWIGSFGIVAGLLLLAFTGQFGAIWLSLIGWFIWRNARAYERLNVIQAALLETQVQAAMSRQFRVVDARLSLREFVETYLIAGDWQKELMFAASEGRYRGLINPVDLSKIERSQWDTMTLQDIAYPLDQIPSVGETITLAEAAIKLEQLSEKYITVLSPAEAVSGTLDRGDIVAAVAGYADWTVAEAEIKRIKQEGTYPNGLPLAAIAHSVEYKTSKPKHHS